MSDSRNESVQSFESLPDWQDDLINQLFVVAKKNYIFSDKIEEKNFKETLKKDFIQINLEFPQADKTKFREEANKALAKFDPHLILIYDPPQMEGHIENKRIDKNTQRFVLDSRPPPEIIEKMRVNNFGFAEKQESIEVPDRVGYVKIMDFLDVIEAKEKALAIMQGFKEKDAIIFDLRDCHGGDPRLVEFILSFLLTEADKAKIPNSTYNTIYDSSTDKTELYKVRPTDFTLNVPIYVLTNELTFSAGEEFAYDLQQLNKHVLQDNRFVIIGQVTAGGAHAVTTFPLIDNTTQEINSEFYLFVPTKNTINPFSQTNWEDGAQIGVRPDEFIHKEKDALEVALSLHHRKEAEQKLLHSSTTLLVTRQMSRDPRSVLKNQAKSSDDISLRPTEEKKAAKEFARSATTKASATDDSNVNYSNKPSRK
jgi:hypothetical protein